jgi:hypothetical protein
MTWTLVIVAAQLAILAAVILHSRWRVRKRLRALPRRAVTARIPAGHPDEGFVLSNDDGRAWTALMATERTP